MRRIVKPILAIVIIISIGLVFNNLINLSIESSLKGVEIINLENDNKVYNQEIKDDENERVVITKSGDIILITTYYKASGAITQETIEMVEQDDSIFAMSEVDAFRKIVIDIITDESSYISINIIDTRQSH